jgi:tRNA A-37 threonylcarbamoyl transferase component Bud32
MAAPVSEGDVVLDKYRVERVLGQGGMGVVVAATHVDLDQRVALKFLLPEALAHPELVERFAREAKAAARIQSQHVVRVLDTGKMPTGAPFMVMEYLEGDDLSDVLEREGRIPVARVVDYLLEACEAVGEAHAAGIVHRDLKPANLFLAKQRDRRSMVKVLDFGISKLDDPTSAPITRTQTMMGSPHYMSPEQLVSSKHVDARSDIWALGVIFYELASGRRPFDGESMPEVVGQILKNEPARLGTLVGDVSLDLELVVARCLASSPSDRFASVAELACALEPFAGDASAAALSVARIGRVLGGASIPPAAGDAPRESRQPVVLVPPTNAAAAAGTVASPRAGGAVPSGMAHDATVHAAAGGTRRGDDVASSRVARATSGTSSLDGALAITPSPSAPARRPAMFVAGVVVVVGLVVALALRGALRAPSGVGGRAAGIDGTRESVPGLVATASPVPTAEVVASGAPSASLPVASASAAAAPDSSTRAMPTAAASSNRKLAATPSTRPSAAPTSIMSASSPASPTTATASAPRKSPLEMGIK